MFIAAATPLLTYEDMSIGQGGIGTLLNGMSMGEKAERLVEISFLSQLEVFNPSIVTTPLKYIDQTKRKRLGFFKSLEEEGSFTKGSARWILNSVTPVYGSYYASMKAEPLYGMFGEEQFSIPAMSQGLVSGTIAKYLKSGKNTEEAKLYQWLDVNGYTKLYKNPPAIPILDEVGNKIVVGVKNTEKYGPIAARLAKDEILERMAGLQAVSDEEGEGAFKSAIDEIFSRNFLYTYMEGEGTLSHESRVKKDEEDKIAFAAKEEARVKDNKEEIKELKKLTNEEITVRQAVKKQPKKVIYLIGMLSTNSQYEGREAKRNYIKHLKKIGAISDEEYDTIKNHFFK
jgi:hypothetical protein